jgi:hypothetical protein
VLRNQRSSAKVRLPKKELMRPRVIIKFDDRFPAAT